MGNLLVLLELAILEGPVLPSELLVCIVNLVHVPLNLLDFVIDFVFNTLFITLDTLIAELRILPQVTPEMLARLDLGSSHPVLEVLHKQEEGRVFELGLRTHVGWPYLLLESSVHFVKAVRHS